MSLRFASILRPIALSVFVTVAALGSVGAQTPPAESPSAKGETAPATTPATVPGGRSDAAPATAPSKAAPPSDSISPAPPPAASDKTDRPASPTPSLSEPPAAIQTPRDDKLPHDLSPLGMFLAADWVVKGVMIALALASLTTWTILLVKGFEVFAAKWRARAGIKRLTRATSLNEAVGDLLAKDWRGPVGNLAKSAKAETERSVGLAAEGIKERVAIGLSRIESNAARSLNRGTGILATIGSIAPFVGLFGTVWGIMNAFIGISEANTTNLAVVAPGIAEALLATAIGLVAAIPAVIVYNGFARAIASYKAMLSDGSALVMQHLSRDLDRSAARGRPARLAEAAE
ncbi:tonB-system energizer ExbB [Jiella flava]|uniref:Biopolymer transport protein ExbB n=1 Tax=Jiella flava TaxID=2816857 RepID=A0A939JSZ7_9HYPH|nr:tonB-system energizer ExbB [Jiella flava]MBO0661610.1 tonB-system energizer ExbB [Jiella flava]